VIGTWVWIRMMKKLFWQYCAYPEFMKCNSTCHAKKKIKS
jgi:hypothetical protein